MGKQRKGLAILLTIAMVMGMMPGAGIMQAFAADTVPEQTEDKLITDWEWVDDWEIIDPDSGNVLLPFASAENVAYFDNIVEMLPTSISAGGEELTLGEWVCEDYPMESGAYEGEYIFETTLPEGYVLSEDSNHLCLTVVLGDTEGYDAAVTFSSGSSGHIHCLCGANHQNIGDHTAEESLEWQPWGSWGTGSAFPVESGNYYLTENVSLYAQKAGWWEIENGITINLCLNGYQFSAGNIRLAQVDKGGKLTITDCVGRGYITAGYASNNYDHCVTIASGGEFCLFGGTLRDFNRIVENSGTFRMYGGSLCNNKGGIDFGGGVYNKKYGTFYMYGGTIRDCSLNSTSYYGGGGVYNDGTVYMSGGSITSCGLGMIGTSATVYASGSGVYNAGTFHMSGGSITKNEASAAENVGKDSYGYGFFNLGTLNLSGNVNISGNVIGTATNGTPANLLIRTEGSTNNPANITGNLDPNATIGVTHVNGEGTVAKVAQGVTAEHSCFLSDNAAWKARKDSRGDIVLVDADLVDVVGTVKVDATAMSGATISFQSESFTGSCTTDSSGNYYLTLCPGTYQVSLKKPSGQVMTIGDQTVPAGTQATIDFNLTKLTGTVKDNNNIPVENVKICFGSDAVSAYSNANGEYTVLMFQDMYANGAVVSVSAESLLYASVTENVTFNANGMTQNFVLSSMSDGATLQVSSEADLVRLASFENQLDGKTIVLAQDIALTEEFKGITLTDRRTITIQGNGHTISNMTTPLFVKQTSTNNSQVLAGKVTDLNLQGNISWDCLYVGALAGDARDITIDDCSFEGSITSKYSNSGRVGGLVGSLTGTMRNCYVSLTKISGGSVYCAGGLCGKADNDSNIIENCYVRIGEYAVTDRNNSYFLGGIFGIYAGTVKNCYVLVTGDQKPEYALGHASGTPTVQNVYAQNGSASFYSEVTQLSADVMSAKTGTTVDSKNALVDRLDASLQTGWKHWYNGTDGYPCFTPVKYTITYSGGSQGTGSQEAQTVIQGEMVFLPGAVYICKNTDKVQKGWATTDGGAKAYDLGGSITLNSGSITLYPYWEDKPIAIYTKPTGIQANYGDTLSNVVLPKGFSWNTPNTSVGDVGSREFTATYTPEDLDTYRKDTNVQITVTVKKVQATFSSSVTEVSNLTYNRTAQELVTAGTTSDGTIVYSLTGNDDYTSTIPTATDPGVYTVYYKILGDTNHEDSEAGSVTVSIGKANLENAVITLGDALTYNGEEQTQSIASVTVGTMTLGEGDYTVTDNTGSAVRTYTLTVTGIGNFEGSKQKEFAIGKKSVTGINQTLLVKPKTSSGQTIDYDLSKLIPDGVTGTTGYAVSTVTNGDGVLSKAPGNDDIKDGILTLNVAGGVAIDLTATVKITFTNANYEISEAVLTIKTIDKTPVTLSGVTCGSRAYNGKAYEYTGIPVWKTADDTGQTVKGETTVTYYAAGESSPLAGAPANAGSYRAEFAVIFDEYTGTASYSFDITKAVATVAAKNKNIYVGDAVPDLNSPKDGKDYTVTGLYGEDKPDGTVSMSYGQQPDNTKTGTYDILIGGLTAPAGDNYTLTFTKGTLTIKAKSSGGGGGLPATPNDQVTQSGDSTTADLSGSTVGKGGETTTTVDQTTADKLVDKAVSNNSEEVIIHAEMKNSSAASSTKSAEVTLPAETLGAIAEKTDADVVIKTDVAEVKLDNKAAEAIAQQAKAAAETAGRDETVSISAEKVKEGAKEVRFVLKVATSGGKVISGFNGGSVSVTVNVPMSLSSKKIVCVYIDGQGHYHKVEGKLNPDGTFTFTTGHFSTYAVMEQEDADKAIEDQKEAIKAIKFKLSSRLVKTKSGKKAVKLIWTNPSDIEFEGVAVYRSTKKNSGYGKKPFFISNSGKYTNTAVKSGKKYYYKVRAFVTIDGERVYTDYSNKAWRTVK